MCVLLALSSVVGLGDDQAPKESKPTIVTYGEAVGEFGVPELRLGIECLSGTLVGDGARRKARVTLLLKEKVYANLPAIDPKYEYVRLLPSNAVKQTSRFRCVTEPVVLDHNGIRGPAYFGLMRFEADVELDHANFDPNEGPLLGEVKLPISSQLTSIVTKRKFALFPIATR